MKDLSRGGEGSGYMVLIVVFSRRKGTYPVRFWHDIF